MEQGQQQLTREKEETEIIKTYEKILYVFEQKKFNEGVDQMRKLLREKLIQQEDFKELRYACYISLADVYEFQIKLDNECLYYLNKAISIKPKEFNIYLKMGQICRRQGYFPQSEQCFWQALQYMPGQSYENFIYENLMAVSFLQQEFETTLKRLDYLIDNNYKVAHNSLIKAIVLQKLGKNDQFNEVLIQTTKKYADAKLSDIELLKEMEEIKQRQQNNQYYTNIIQLYNKQEEFYIFIDKQNWGCFLKLINDITKLFKLSMNNESIPKKNKKLQKMQLLFSSIKDKNLNLCNTIIVLKEKREQNGHIPKEWDFIKRDKGSAIKKKDNKKISSQQSKIQPQKVSDRIKKNISNFQTNSNLSIESLIKVTSKKDNIPTRRKLQDLCDNFYDKIDAQGKQKFDNLFGKLISADEELEILDENKQQQVGLEQMTQISQMIPEQLNNESSALSQKVLQANQIEDEDEEEDISKDEIQQSFNKHSNEDFETFFTKAKHQKFINFPHLITEILQYFIENQTRKLPDTLKSIEEYSYCQETFEYCPSFYLQNFSQCKPYKHLIMKLFLRGQQFCNNYFENDINCQLTLFELLMDIYQSMIKQQDTQQQILGQKKKEKLKMVQQLLKEYCFNFFKYNQESIFFRIRALHILAHFFSLKSFENNIFATICLKNLLQECISSNIEEGEKGQQYNLFWLNSKLINLSIRETIENRLRENHQKQETSSTQRVQTEKQEQQYSDTFEGQQTYINEQMIIFEGKLQKNIEDSFDNNYKNILDLLMSEKIKKNLFLSTLIRILHLYFICLNKKPPKDDQRKNIIKLDSGFRIDNLIKECLKKLNGQKKQNQENQIVVINEENNNNKNILANNNQANIVLEDNFIIQSLEDKDNIIEINLCILKMTLIKLIIIEFDNHWNLLSLFAKTAQILINAYLKDQIVNKSKIFFFFHFLIHLSTEPHIIEYHNKILEEKIFNEYIESIFQYLKEVELKKNQLENEKQLLNQDDKMQEQNNNNQEDEEDDEDLNRDQDDQDYSVEDIYSDDIKILEEIKNIYQCFYGIKGRKKRKMKIFNDCLCKWSLDKYVDLNEIFFIIQFLKKIFPSYFTDNQARINSHIQKLLIFAHKFMQTQDLSLCTKLQEKKKQLQEWINKSHGSNQNESNQQQQSEQAILQYLQEKLKAYQNQKEIKRNCFCEKMNCLDNIMKNDFFSDLLFLVGRAYEECDPNDIKNVDENQKQKSLIHALRKADKMFSLHILLKPESILSWYSLGSIYTRQSFLYFDSCICEPMSDSISELKTHYLFAKRAYNFILQNFPPDHNLYRETEEDLLILNLVKMYERKYIYITSLKSASQESEYEKDSLFKRNKLDEILDKIYDEDKYNFITPRIIILKQLFIARSLYNRYNFTHLSQHFEKLLNVKKIIEDLDCQQVNNEQLNQLFNGEAYDYELQCELYISYYKIFFNYLKIIKLLKGKYEENQDNSREKINQELKQKTGIQLNNELILKIILKKCDQLIQFIKKVDNDILNECLNDKISSSLFLNKQLVLTNKLTEKLQKIIYSQIQEEKNNTEVNNNIQNLEQYCQNMQNISENKILSQIDIIFTNCSNKLQNLALRNQKKYKYKRFVIRSFFYNAKIQVTIEMNYEKGFKSLNEIFNFKLDEIVTFYTHNENASIEKDQKLSFFFVREIVFIQEKYKYIKLMSTILREIRDCEKLGNLNKKLLKAMIKKNEQGKEKVNKLYSKLYCMTINDLTEAIRRKMELNETDQDRNLLIKKQLHNLYCTNFKQKSTSKHVESEVELIQKMKRLFVDYYNTTIQNKDTQIKENFDNNFNKAVKYLEDVFKKQKKKQKKEDNDKNDNNLEIQSQKNSTDNNERSKENMDIE